MPGWHIRSLNPVPPVETHGCVAAVSFALHLGLLPLAFPFSSKHISKNGIYLAQGLDVWGSYGCSLLYIIWCNLDVNLWNFGFASSFVTHLMHRMDQTGPVQDGSTFEQRPNSLIPQVIVWRGTGQLFAKDLMRIFCFAKVGEAENTAAECFFFLTRVYHRKMQTAKVQGKKCPKRNQ